MFRNRNKLRKFLPIILIGLFLFIFSPKIYKLISSKRLESNIKKEISTSNLQQVSAMALGKWRSILDPKFVREFRKDGFCVDYYDGEEGREEKYGFFDSKSVPKTMVKNPEEGSIYLYIGSVGGEGLHFEITKISEKEFDMVYLEKGNTLSFKKI